jgi:Rhodopirellula transposase DDE domain
LKKKPDIIDVLRELLKDETAGDPVKGIKWTRKTVRHIAHELDRKGFKIGRETVRRLILSLGYRLRSNRKRLTRKQDARRDKQMRYIIRARRVRLKQGKPVISVDTKHRELVGNFKKTGRTWRLQPIDVMDSDYPSDGKGVAIPYGIYDVANNQGFVVVGISCQTPEFAANSIRMWWVKEGRDKYPEAVELLIEADGGNPNGSRGFLFKYALQGIANEFGLVITVCHYPPGASKWNPIEHKLFSQISSNWAGQPLTTYQLVLNYIRTTRTQTGLKCRAYIDTRKYQTKLKISKQQKSTIRLSPHRVHPELNYTIKPNKF